MKILAVSDTTSRSLENLVVREPQKLKDINLILACGDLDSEYIEFLVDGLNKELFFVSGNHLGQMNDDVEEYPARSTRKGKFLVELDTFNHKNVRRISGQVDLHGRVEIFKNYIIAGFGGARWYSGRGNEYTEDDMAGVVRRVQRVIRFYQIRDRFLGRPPKEVIIISHAPPYHVHDLPDACHTGFKCFHPFIDKIKPLLWVHGHVHLQDVHHTQIDLVRGTTVVNAYGYKFIKVEKREINIAYRYDVLDK